MSISFSGRGSDNVILLEAIKVVLDEFKSSRKVHYGQSPPSVAIEGDLWYNPTEDRYYGYVEE